MTFYNNIKSMAYNHGQDWWFVITRWNDGPNRTVNLLLLLILGDLYYEGRGWGILRRTHHRSPPNFNFRQVASKQWLLRFSLTCFRRYEVVMNSFILVSKRCSYFCLLWSRNNQGSFWGVFVAAWSVQASNSKFAIRLEHSIWPRSIIIKKIKLRKRRRT